MGEDRRSNVGGRPPRSGGDAPAQPLDEEQVRLRARAARGRQPDGHVQPAAKDEREADTQD